MIFIAMRYVEGSDLKHLLRAGPLAPDRALAIVTQIARALDAAHERGLVNRDVKPSNVLIAPGAAAEGADHVYLVDFGLSTRRTELRAADSDATVLGTIDYVAPEQIRGADINGRADVYALGCLLYECLAGRPPFAGRSDAAVLFAHLREDPPELPGLEAVLRRALAKSPADRYESCRDLVEAARSSLGYGSAGQSKRVRATALAGGVLAVTVVALVVLLTRAVAVATRGDRSADSDRPADEPNDRLGGGWA